MIGLLVTNDRIMFNLNNRQKDLLVFYSQDDTLTPNQVLDDLNLPVSLVTMRRDIRELVDLGFLKEEGAGPALRYFKTTLGALFSPYEASEYQNQTFKKFDQKISFNQKLFPEFPSNVFSEKELYDLDEATKNYQVKLKTQTENIKAKELERFVIELSWKSSKIEGNTYTLLDTEKLLREGTPANGKTTAETTMILNHKTAFDFVLENKTLVKTKNLLPFLEELHRLLTDNLLIDQGIRKALVGITGTNYLPLGISFKIEEALTELFLSLERSESFYQKALLALAGTSYIQPFVDGNKRTARLFANAFLLAENLAPLSYRNVDEKDYREAILVFYEQNSIIPLKKIFVEQYLFSAEFYAV